MFTFLQSYSLNKIQHVNQWVLNRRQAGILLQRELSVWVYVWRWTHSPSDLAALCLSSRRWTPYDSGSCLRPCRRVWTRYPARSRTGRGPWRSSRLAWTGLRIREREGEEECSHLQFIQRDQGSDQRGVLPIPTGRFAPMTSFSEKEKSSRLLVKRQKALNSSNVMLCKTKCPFTSTLHCETFSQHSVFYFIFMNLSRRDLLPHVLPVDVIVLFVGVV